MKDDAAPDQAPTMPAIPLRTRQRHRARQRKESVRKIVREEVPLESATFATVAAPLEEDFFAAGDSVAPVVHDEPSSEEPALPLDHAPRRGLAAIVSGAVALAGVLCGAALAKPHPAPAPVPAVAAVAPPPVVDDIPEPPPPVEAPVVQAPAPVPAKALRESARASLVKHELPEAIAAADDATTAAPEEAEGWLLLGAAQLEAGHATQAQQTFRTCVRVAKSGPVGECRSFATR